MSPKAMINDSLTCKFNRTARERDWEGVMELGVVSHGLLPYGRCSDAIAQQRLSRLCNLEQSNGIRKSKSLSIRELRTSLDWGRKHANHVTLSKFITRARNVERDVQAGDSEFRDDVERKVNYVATRTYRKALASLRVAGEALPSQVNAAMAADGGRTAAQELARGIPTLMIETFNPGRFSEGSTVCTKLQAPTLTVVERAKSMQKRESEFSPSGRAFAIAFQSVRLLNISKFEMCFYKPGTVKGTDSYQKGEMFAFLEVSDPNALSEIAKGVCAYALAGVKAGAHQRANVNWIWTRFFRKSQGVKQIACSSSVHVSTLSESEVVGHVEMILQGRSLVGTSLGIGRHKSWWERPPATQAIVKTGVDAQLVDEFVPAHVLEFKLPSGSLKAVGLHKTSDTTCAVHLTHAQMMDLADVLDMYCGDPYTGSGEDVSTSMDIPRRFWSKVAQTLAFGVLASAIGGALFLGLLSVARTRGHIESPPMSIFDMAFLEKLKDLRGSEPVDEPDMKGD